MAGPELPEIPAPLKSIQHYLKIAAMYDQRDCVVSYWCRLYALQTGLKLSTKTAEETNFLLKLMDWLETTKKEQHENEAITNDVAAQAHLENWALKLFLYADNNDRAGVFNKNVVQSFYVAGTLYDVLVVFGELSVEAIQNRKYAKWKAAYIHNCLKNGDTPVPGPMKEEEDEFNINENTDEASQPTSASDFPKPPSGFTAPADKPKQRESSLPSTPTGNNLYNPLDVASMGVEGYNSKVQTEGGVTLSVEQVTKAQKLIKWAGSALNFDDVPAAITNLQKALHLLTTGQDQA